MLFSGRFFLRYIKNMVIIFCIFACSSLCAYDDNLSCCYTDFGVTKSFSDFVSYEFPSTNIYKSNVDLVAVQTFNSIGLYWRPASGGVDKEVLLRYRVKGDKHWTQGHSLWFDSRNHSGAYLERSEEYRGSIVLLKNDTEYDIEVIVLATGEYSAISIKTWADELPIAKTVELPKKMDKTLLVAESGTKDGYILYTGNSEIDVAESYDHGVIVSASYIIIRGLKIRNSRSHAIFIKENTHDVVIDRNDISAWGRVENNFPVNYESGVYAKGNVARIVIQNNKIHHPATGANSWDEYNIKGDTHPIGPQAITFFNTTGNNVIRNNYIFSSVGKYFNDCIGGGSNFSYMGFPGRDSDIYGNFISHCWDDAIESEGGNLNVRIYLNYIDKSYVSFALSPTVMGPVYVFRNIAYRSQRSLARSLSSGSLLKVQLKTLRDGRVLGGGRVFYYHNTAYRDASGNGMAVGIHPSGSMLVNFVSRNNIIDVGGVAISDPTRNSLNSFDYDIYSKYIDIDESVHERFGVKGKVFYEDGAFSLVKGSIGYDMGDFIPNFSDRYFGDAPDIGAVESGSDYFVFDIRH